MTKRNYKSMMKESYSDFEIAVIKLAKKFEISMTRSSAELVEFWEEDIKKAYRFTDEIRKLNPKTKFIELISTRQHKDTKGFDIRNSKSLYLTDDDYYNALIGNESDQEVNVYEDNEQVSLFDM